ncbi:MAG: NADPH-dependent FMN reductase [Pseudorhodoplanes sp.]
MHKVAVLVGSLRRDSINMKLAKALAGLGQSRFDFRFLALADMPVYNEDLWQNPPPAVLKMKADIENADAVLFVTPEYNRSIPPVVKNAIDWGSRPWGKNSWAGKAASVVGASPGAVGTAVAQSHLRSILPTLDMNVLGQPEVYFVNKDGLIDGDHAITNEGTRQFLEGYLAKLDAFIARHKKAA